MKYSAVILDLDGTLTYTLEDLWVSTNYALEQMDMPERTLDEVRTFVGNGIGNLVRRAMGDNVDEETFQRCLAIFSEHYVKHCFDNTRLYDGIDNLLHSLRKGGVKSAIVSNKLQEGVNELYRKYFADTVDVAIGEHEGCRRKPAPDMVDEAIKKLGVSKEECLYVGDSEVDVQTARNSGLRCISVLWGFRDREELERAGATTFISDPCELLKFFVDYGINS